mgnify:CR=1 FL=1
MWGGDSHPHLHDDLIQQFRCRSGTGIQKGKIGIAVVACVVVDAQVYMACVLRHTVIFAKQLQTGHVTAITVRGSNSPLNSRGS